MTPGNFLKRFAPSVDLGDLEELRRGTIIEISAVVFVILWFLMVTSYDNPQGLVVAFILLGCSAGSVWLSGMSLRAALAWLVLTLLAAIASQKWLFPESAAQYYFPVVVVVSSLLVSSTNVFLVALLANVTLLFVARLQGFDWLDTEQVTVPLFITLITACAAWIGSRQIRLALAWLRNSYANTSTLLDQLRDERASLARTIKMLEEAYVRIEKMNYALIEARSVAENARQLKAEFAANISHELRTPLNLIIGFSETMANAPETYQSVTWSPALRADIQQIYQSSRHLSSLIDDILDLSALDAQRLGFTLEDAKIEDIIAEAMAVTQDLFRAKKLSLKVETATGLPPLRVDATRIRQVMINLLTNASRFTQVGGVTITVKVVHSNLQIAVKDTGIGIAPQDVAKVFEEFGQVDGSTTRKHEGTGLGVPLSKRLVEAHNGRMWLESIAGVGTTFYFTLPLTPPSAHALYSAANANAALPTYRKTILVLERDPLLLRILHRHLSSYDVIAVEHLAELDTLIAQHQPLALIVNTDEDAADSILEQLPKDLPVIRFALVGALRAAQLMGVQDYLIKPILREQLLNSVVSLSQNVRQVLVVDDDPESVELLGRMLQSAGEAYRVIKVFGGAEALARLRSEQIDLVLLDLSMPEMDGIAVLKEMKADPSLAAIPVIVTSAQQPEAASAADQLFVQLHRPTHASTTETLNYLQALIDALPLRGLPGDKS